MRIGKAGSIRLATALSLGIGGAALGDYPSGTDDAELAFLFDRIEAGDVEPAETRLRAVLEDRPGDEDVLSLLGYANRKLARYDDARGFYERALRQNPRHRGALSYMGALEVETGNVAAARDLRARLAAICPSGCDELRALDAALAGR